MKNLKSLKLGKMQMINRTFNEIKCKFRQKNEKNS
jgi:hypothetical protein